MPQVLGEGESARRARADWSGWGRALAGALVSLIGAPWAVVVDAVSYLFSGLMLLGIRVDEPRAGPGQRGDLGRDIGEGLAFVYRHPTLAPFALNTHAWFIFSGISGAVVAPFVLRTVQLSPLALGVAASPTNSVAPPATVVAPV